MGLRNGRSGATERKPQDEFWPQEKGRLHKKGYLVRFERRLRYTSSNKSEGEEVERGCLMS